MRTTLALLFVLLSRLLTAAEVPTPLPASSPEAVLTLYMKALQVGAFDDATALMDPNALTKFKEMLLPILAEAPGTGDTAAIRLLDGVADPTAAKALSGAGFLGAFLRGLSKQNPAVAEALRSATGDLVGSVSEGANTVHIVCRTRARVADVAVTKMTVVTLNLVDGRWRVALSGEIEGMGQALRRALAPPKEPGGA